MSSNLKPGDLAKILMEGEAWHLSDTRYEDWLTFDRKTQGDIVLIVNISLSPKGSPQAHVVNEKGSAVVGLKFLKKVD